MSQSQKGKGLKNAFGLKGALINTDIKAQDMKNKMFPPKPKVLTQEGKEALERSKREREDLYRSPVFGPRTITQREFNQNIPKQKSLQDFMAGRGKKTEELKKKMGL